jgi:predicted esterase
MKTIPSLLILASIAFGVPSDSVKSAKLPVGAGTADASAANPPAAPDSARSLKPKTRPAYVHHALPQKKLGFYAVYLPRKYQADSAKGKKYPLCVILHGSGSTETGHGSMALPYADEDIIFMAPRAPNPDYEAFLDEHMEGWTARAHYPAEWGRYNDKDFPRQELQGLDEARYYADWIADCIRDMRKRYPLAEAKAVVVGHSQGASFAHIAAARHPELIRAYAAYAGSYHFLEDDAAAQGLRSGNVFSEVIHCEADSTSPVAESRKLIRYLDAHKLPHEDRIFPGGNHKLGARPASAIRDFVYKWCLGKKAPPLKGILLIDEVVPGSRADSLGLLAGDRIKSYDGKPIRDAEAFLAAREAAMAKKTVTLEVERASKVISFAALPGRLGILLGDR